MYASLSPESKAIANKYVRITIRGKKNRTVPVLLYPQLVKNIDLILKYRIQAKVPAHNKYLFGLPYYNKKRTKVVDACEAMRKYSSLCGAKIPEFPLRGTKLRKHIATQCVNLNLDDNEVSDLANFMGHAEKIHKEIYRQPIKSREILGISRLLETAQGEDEYTDDSDDDDSSNTGGASEKSQGRATEEYSHKDANQESVGSSDIGITNASMNNDIEFQERSSLESEASSRADIVANTSADIFADISSEESFGPKKRAKRRAEYTDINQSAKRKKVTELSKKGKKQTTEGNTGKFHIISSTS